VSKHLIKLLDKFVFNASFLVWNGITSAAEKASLNEPIDRHLRLY
jgi:hypothetical protein